MKKPTSSILVPTISIVTGAIVYLVLSGILIPGFNPLTGIVEATSYGSFDYVTNLSNYEASTVSYNMEDMYNSTHLYDFSEQKHYGRKDSPLEPDIGIYGQSLRWPGGQIVVEDLDIVDTSFTIEAWIYPTSQDPLSLAGVETLYPFIFKAQNGSMQYQYGGGPSVLYSNQTVGLNVWTHVALVYDAISGVAKWYLNGSERGSKNVGARNDWDGLWSIGRMRPDYATFEWKGMIDEFRIYKNEARTQKEIQDDMKTSIAHKLTFTGLAPNSDIVQLWYQDGEFPSVPMLQKTADADGQVEFNIYSFSGRSPFYKAILRVARPGRIYTSPNLNFAWEDVYQFSLHTYFNEALIATLASAMIIIVPSTLLVIYSHKRSRHKTPPSRARVTKMHNSYRFDRLEKTITHDKKLLFTLCSFVLTLGIYINLSFFQLPVIGIITSFPYFLINGIFLGHAFFEKEDTFFRLMLGILLLIMLLGFVGWLAVIIYNLDVFRFTLVLLVVATLSSLLNRKVKNKIAS